MSFFAFEVSVGDTCAWPELTLWSLMPVLAQATFRPSFKLRMKESCPGLTFKLMEVSWSYFILEANHLLKLTGKPDTHSLVLSGLWMLCVVSVRRHPPHPVFNSLIIYLWIFVLIIWNNLANIYGVLTIWHTLSWKLEMLYLSNSHNDTMWWMFFPFHRWESQV